VAVAGLNYELDELFEEFQSEFIEIRATRGRDNIFPHFKNWQFHKYSYNHARAELILFVSRGIYQFWKYWFRDRKYVESKLLYESTVQPEALTRSTNVAFIFVVLVFGQVVSVSVFTAENSGSHGVYDHGELWNCITLVRLDFKSSG